MATSENLEQAFAGESQANRKYLAFAKKAEAEGFPMVAKIFRAAAEAETVHAHAHLRAMGGIRSTQENLEEAIKGESLEFKHMYPPYIEQAEAEDAKAALRSFKNAMAVEQVHHSLYIEALNAVKSGSDQPDKKICVCSVCGNTAIGGPPETCPGCGAPRERFNGVP
jgi:rubrerythrin